MIRFWLLFLLFTCALTLTSQKLETISYIDPIKTSHLNALAAQRLVESNPRAAIRISKELIKEFKEGTNEYSEASSTIGYAYANLNIYDSSFYFLNKALSSYKLKTNSLQIAKIEIKMARNNLEQGRHLKAIEHASNALKENLKIHDSSGLCNSLQTLGRIYRDKKDLPMAEKTLKEALIISRRIKDSTSMAAILNSLGITLKRLHNPKDAIVLYEESFKISMNKKDSSAAAYSLGFIGTALETMGEYEKALNYQNRTLEILIKLNDKVGLTEVYMNIGILYLRKKDYKTYIDYQFKALSLAKSLGSLEGLHNIYNNISYGYSNECLNNPVKELEYLKLCYSLKDSLFNTEIANEITKTQTTLEYEKKIAIEKVEQRKKDELSLQKLKEQRYLSIIAVFCIFILSGALFTLYRNFIYKQRTALQLSIQNIEIEKQKETIEQKNKLVTESIDYAKRIQDAFIQSEIVLQETKVNYFLINQPKDIVSGDFLWAKRKDDNLLFAVADCTGHGVPGAFISLVGYSLLEQAADVYKLNEPKAILDNVNLQLKKVLKPKDGVSSYEGMDVLICRLDLKTNLLQLAGTKHRLYHFSNSILKEYRTDSITIGFEITKKFNQLEIQLQETDIIYLFTDGFPDQKGGPDKIKLYYEPFKNLVLAHSNESLSTQKELLLKHLNDWKGQENQVDDILVFGLKI